MNKDKYNRLPEDLKKVIDDNSGAALAANISNVFDVSNDKAMAAAKEKGDVMIDIPDPLNDPNWKGPLIEGSQKYLDEVNATGLDADAVYEKIKVTSKTCAV